MAKIRQEINILDVLVTTTAGNTATSSAIVQLDTSQYSGTATYYFEVVASGGTGSTVKLRRSGTTTDDASCATNNASLTRVRSTSFTPPTGATEYVAFFTAGALATQNVKSA